MAFKPNYNQQRVVRARAKEQKKQEKLARKQEDAPKAEQPAEDGDLATPEQGETNGS